MSKRGTLLLIIIIYAPSSIIPSPPMLPITILSVTRILLHKVTTWFLIILRHIFTPRR